VDPGSVIGYHIGGAIRRTHNLQGNEDNVDQLAQEHAAQGAELEETNARIAQVESVHAEHAQEDGEQQSGVQMIAVSAGIKII